MRNLFICHSQSHLILSAGLSKGRFAKDENHLILFKDFNLKEELKERLVNVFDSTLFLEGTYPAAQNMTVRGRVRWYRKDVRILQEELSVEYDRLFAVCGTYPVLFIIKKCLDSNQDIEVNWLEDGIIPYFANTKAHMGLDSNAFTRRLRVILYRKLLRLGNVCDRDFDEMGGLSVFKNAYVSYPEAVRDPYKKKKLIGISSDEFNAGVNELYLRHDLAVPNGAILLVMDKLDTYFSPDKVKSAIRFVFKFAKTNGIPVYCKLHPREDIIWEELENCIQLDKAVGAESMYLSLLPQREDIHIIGIKSAGLMTAVKMGFKVNSLFPKCGELNADLELFFKSIGIHMLYGDILYN